MGTFKDFCNRIAVVTGAASGIGREIALELVRKGTHVAICDIDREKLESTAIEARNIAPHVLVSTHPCDVSDETQVRSLVAEVKTVHKSDSIHLLFNVAGIVGGRSFIKSSRKDWEKTFNVSWMGTYLCTRLFLPMLLKAQQGVVINVSSISGLWASLGQKEPHSAYSTAKFAVRGFTESLIVDFQANAPHLSAVLVIPGHVQTGMPAPPKSWRHTLGDLISDYTPVTAKKAAEMTLDAVSNGDWRVVIGEDAHRIDQYVRANASSVYD